MKKIAMAIRAQATGTAAQRFLSTEI